jgi:ABC-type Fe3+ transport system substrate-binding protein
VVRHLGVSEPKTWADLTDPRYRGWLVLADPSRSASVRTTLMAIVEKAMADAWDADTEAKAKHAGLKEQQAAAERAGDKDAAARLKREADGVYQQAMDPGWRRGMGLVRQIAANARVFTDNSASVPATVGAGDAAAGMAIDFYGRTEVEFSGESRVGYVEPVGATIVNPDPIALVRGAEHRDAALRFVEFVLSTDGQRLWNARVGPPAAPAAPPSAGCRSSAPCTPTRRTSSQHFADRVNPYEVAGSFNTRSERKQTFQIIGELIQASCLDLLPELREARAAILASPKARSWTGSCTSRSARPRHWTGRRGTRGAAGRRPGDDAGVGGRVRG